MKEMYKDMNIVNMTINTYWSAFTQVQGSWSGHSISSQTNYDSSFTGLGVPSLVYTTIHNDLDEIKISNLELNPGTYNINVVYYKSPDSGISEILYGNTVIGSTDLYSPSVVPNFVKTYILNVSNTTIADLRFRVNGTSYLNYFIGISSINVAQNCGTKNVGDNVTLTVNITQGVAPYTIIYKKNGLQLPGGMQIQPVIGTYSFVYITMSIDAGTSLTFSAEILDSCVPTQQTFVDQCIISVNSLPILTDIVMNPGNCANPLNKVSPGNRCTIAVYGLDQFGQIYQIQPGTLIIWSVNTSILNIYQAAIISGGQSYIGIEPVSSTTATSAIVTATFSSVIKTYTVNINQPCPTPSCGFTWTPLNPTPSDTITFTPIDNTLVNHIWKVNGTQWSIAPTFIIGFNVGSYIIRHEGMNNCGSQGISVEKTITITTPTCQPPTCSLIMS